MAVTLSDTDPETERVHLELLRAAGPARRALEQLGVRYYVGGSVASSVHGVPRSSVDASPRRATSFC